MSEVDNETIINPTSQHDTLNSRQTHPISHSSLFPYIEAAAKMQLSMGLGKALSHFLLELDNMRPLIPTYAHLLVSALFPLYIGTHASLIRPSSAAKPPKKCDHDNDEDEEDQEEGGAIQRMEGMELSDAIMFPIMSGLTLAGLYFLIKALEDPAILNKILSWYFSNVGFFFATSFMRDALNLLRSFAFPTRYSRNGKLWKVDQQKRLALPVSSQENSVQPLNTPLPMNFPLPTGILTSLWSLRGILYQKASLLIRVTSKVDFKCGITILDILSVIAAATVTGIFAFGLRTWWITNLLGFCFCYGALQFMSPTTFWTGTLILGSLFLYDIYFVFFTPMMVTVAQKLDIPIKLLFPRPAAPGQDPDLVSLAMLGLGDIVVPGMMIGMCLRFDHYLYYLLMQKPSTNGPVKPHYLKATGGWGERFWTRISSVSDIPEDEAAYFGAKSFPKTYFRNSIIGYVAGMVTTLIAMQISSHPQPALLYLVPSVLSSIWITAFVKGDVRTIWNFTDESPHDDDGKATKNEKKDQEKDAEKSTQGFFSKIFFGGRKQESKDEARKEKPKALESTNPQTKKKQEKDDSPTDLFSLTISIPRKTKPHGAKEVNPTEKEEDETTAPSTQHHTPGSSGNSTPVLVDSDSPRPVKRRKGNGHSQA